MNIKELEDENYPELSGAKFKMADFIIYANSNNLTIKDLRKEQLPGGFWVCHKLNESLKKEIRLQLQKLGFESYQHHKTYYFPEEPLTGLRRPSITVYVGDNAVNLNKTKNPLWISKMFELSRKNND